MLLFTTLTSLFPGESGQQLGNVESNPELFGIVGLDPWYTFNADPVNFPNDVNRSLLERMASDMSQLGARWIRIEFHAEYGVETGPGEINFAKHDWFINEVAPKYGLKILAVLGSGLIGDKDPAWSFNRINDPLLAARSNAYIDLYVERVQEIIARYRERIAAVEVLNEPNANEVLSNGTSGLTKAVLPANYGELIRRVYDVVKFEHQDSSVVMGGVLFDNENGTSYEVRGRSYDMDWLEAVYASRAVMSFHAEYGHHPFDAIGVHPYFMDPLEVIDYLHQVRDLQIRFGDRSGRVWITEIGWPAEPDENVNAWNLGVPSESERQQAAFLSAIYTSVQQRAAFVERVFWFKYEDFPVNGDFNGWGLVRLAGAHDEYGSYSTPWPRKFAFAVYQALAGPEYLPVAPVDEPQVTDGVEYFPATGHTLREPFLDYWSAHGGAVRFGLPLTEPFDQGGRMVQYFERARLEFYPEYTDTGWAIQLGHIGRVLVEARGLESSALADHGNPAHQFFPETGFSITGAFRMYWESNQGLETLGLPITSEIIENGILVQYFERARLEYVPRPDGTGYVVRLGNVGSEVLQTPGWYR